METHINKRTLFLIFAIYSCFSFSVLRVMFKEANKPMASTPKSLMELASESFLGSCKTIPFPLLLRPRTGLLTIFTKEKFKEPRAFCQALAKAPSQTHYREGPIRWSGKNCTSYDACYLREHFKCLKCYRTKIYWPVVRRLIDRGWPDMIRFFNSRISDQKLLLPSLVYCLVSKNWYCFYQIYRTYCYIKSNHGNTLTELLSIIMKMNKKEKIEIIDDLLEIIDELQNNYNEIKFSVVRALTERDIEVDDFLRVSSMCSCFLKTSSNLKTTAISSFKRGNSKIFFHAIKSRPKLIKMFYKPKHLKYFLDTSKEILEFFLSTQPELLFRLNNWLISDRRYKDVTLILEKDLRNLHELNIFREFFSTKNTMYKLFDFWFQNMQSMHQKRMTSDYYFSTLYTIIKCMDEYGLSVQEPGNKFCKWFFEQVNDPKGTIFSKSNSYSVADKALHIFIEHGYVFSENLPTKIHSVQSKYSVANYIKSNYWYFLLQVSDIQKFEKSFTTCRAILYLFLQIF